MHKATHRSAPPPNPQIVNRDRVGARGSFTGQTLHNLVLL